MDQKRPADEIVAIDDASKDQSAQISKPRNGKAKYGMCSARLRPVMSMRGTGL